MTISASYPFNLVNGTTADASQVQANFNQIQSDVNTYAAPLASPIFTGVPQGPTAPRGTNTTQLATMAALLAATGSYRAYESHSANTTLTNADIGKFIYGSGTGWAFTLPLANTCQAGDSVVLSNAYSGYITVAKQGSDTIFSAGNLFSPFPLYTGATVTFVTDGSSVWYASVSNERDLPGTISMYASSTVPAGVLECNGSAISRTTYGSLFQIIGTTWGAGDGSTTFNLPDFRGQFLRGWDHGAGVDSGRAFASSQTSQNLSHTHTASVTDPGHYHLSGDAPSNPSVRYSITGTAINGNINVQSGSSTTAALTSTQTTGVSVSNASSGGSEARPINMAIMFVIAY